MVSFLIACAFVLAVMLFVEVATELRLAPHKARLAQQAAQQAAQPTAQPTVLLMQYCPVTDCYYCAGEPEPALSAEDERELEALGLRGR